MPPDLWHDQLETPRLIMSRKVFLWEKCCYWKQIVGTPSMYAEIVRSGATPYCYSLFSRGRKNKSQTAALPSHAVRWIQKEIWSPQLVWLPIPCGRKASFLVSTSRRHLQNVVYPAVWHCCVYWKPVNTVADSDAQCQILQTNLDWHQREWMCVCVCVCKCGVHFLVCI